MKILNFKYLVILFASFVLVSACSDDPKEEVVSFAGNYVINHAAVAKTFYLYTSTGDSLPAIVGTDITQAIQTALLGAVNCDSASKSYVELRDDFSIYMSCELQNELNAGTWEEISATELKLNMNSAAIPSSPTGIALAITEIEKDATGWTGTTSVPMPKEMFASNPQLILLGITLAETPTVYVVTFSLNFIEK